MLEPELRSSARAADSLNASLFPFYLSNWVGLWLVCHLQEWRSEDGLGIDSLPSCGFEELNSVFRLVGKCLNLQSHLDSLLVYIQIKLSLGL